MDRQELHIFPNLVRWCSSTLLPISRASWKLSQKFQQDLSDSRQTGRLPHIHRRWSGFAAWDERCVVVDEDCVLSATLLVPLKKKNRQVSSLPVVKARSTKKAAKRPPPSGIAAPLPKRQCQDEFQVHSAVSQERFAWKTGCPRSQWSFSHPDPLRFRPSDAGKSCRFAPDKQPSVTRGSHSAWSRRRGQPHSSSSQASWRGPSHKAMCFFDNLSTLPKYLRSW